MTRKITRRVVSDDEIHADEEQITACTRCNRTMAAVVHHAPNTYGARCRHDVRGEHKWWTGTLRQWFAR
jgi:hypothetical protein